MPTISPFKNIEKKYDVFRCKDRIKKLRESLRKHVVEMIDLKKMRPLTNGQQYSYQNAKTCYICKEKFEDKNAKDKTFRKVGDHCHYTGKYFI